MTKSHYPYPPDEFDVRGPEGSPVGVHREPRSGWSSAWPFLLVAVVFAGLAVAVVGFLSDDPGATENPPAAQQESAAPESSAEGEASEDDGSGEESGDGSGEESGEESGDGSGEESGEESGDGSGEESGEATEEPAEGSEELPGDPGAADLSARVVVYNDGAGNGEAGNAQSVVVGDAGFADVAIDNASNAPVALEGVYGTTTVLYADGRADTASAVAESLGVTGANMELSDDLTNSPTDAVWVVLKEPVG
ncbi:LytR C-terminal domain-containing protein [Isoptericola sp. b408]|uniref:LytR C-terminal domain-containing protein n=1 Tax=Isoptericola sp. b408 TaxID=3064653 RepID=UPI00271274D0|nr:LytR C-terminal domain-containing protein [Isoptericola sp. b408]MDO8152268.1 LytR C-terminal domain-containing protein [Isoptericola sp. b408]